MRGKQINRVRHGSVLHPEMCVSGSFTSCTSHQTEHLLAKQERQNQSVRQALTAARGQTQHAVHLHHITSQPMQLGLFMCMRFLTICMFMERGISNCYLCQLCVLLRPRQFIRSQAVQVLAAQWEAFMALEDTLIYVM